MSKIKAVLITLGLVLAALLAIGWKRSRENGRMGV